MEYMFMPLKRYSTFPGRSRRKEYWLFVLFYMVVLVGAMLLDTQLGLGGLGHQLCRLRRRQRVGRLQPRRRSGPCR